MRFTADYEKSVRLNKDRESVDVYTYWPELCVSSNSNTMYMDHDLISYMESEYEKWPLTAGMKADVLDFSKGIARVYGMFPEVPWDRLSFGHKHFAAAFFVDDPYEECCRLGVCASFGTAYIQNLCTIVSNGPNMIDLKGLESDLVSRRLIDDCLFAQECLKSATACAFQTLTRQQFKHCQVNAQLFLEYLIRESVTYTKAVQEKKLIDYEVMLETRGMTIGFEYVLNPVYPQDESIHDRLMQHFNPFVHICSAVVAIDNDIASAAKEKGLPDGSQIAFSNFYFCLLKEYATEMEAVREAVLRRNAMALHCEQEIKMLPKSWRKSYENTLKLCYACTDYHYLLGHGRPNPRYGVTWRKS